SGVRKTMVSDRESDIYSAMSMTLASGCDFLIRSVHDRPVDCDVEGGSIGLKEYMLSQPVALEYSLELRGHKGRQSRTAKMTLRFAKVTFSKNDKCLDDVPASRMFDGDEQELLSLEMERLHQKSPKAMDGNNPFRENSLPWAAWIIPRWMERPRQGARQARIHNHEEGARQIQSAPRNHHLHQGQRCV
ncbi:MAG: hypothetical protein IJP74_13285, partial [Prevotella sp.]|nr:hypothetical protein [Prevotella sp.]